jgi:hypothetical protein
MKTKITLFLMSLAVLISCSKGNDEVIETTANLDQLVPVTFFETDLIAGQNITIGTVNFAMDNNDLIVTYQTVGTWEIQETHLFVGDRTDLPTNRPGNPIIGRFPYSGVHDAGTNQVVYTIPSVQAGINYIAAHAVVIDTSTGVTETAWGDGEPIGGHSWAMGFEITVPGGPF